jgi:hypothetical protein
VHQINKRNNFMNIAANNDAVKREKEKLFEAEARLNNI